MIDTLFYLVSWIVHVAKQRFIRTLFCRGSKNCVTKLAADLRSLLSGDVERVDSIWLSGPQIYVWDSEPCEDCL